MLRFPSFRPKFIVFPKKKGLHLKSSSDFSRFVTNLLCSLKKKIEFIVRFPSFRSKFIVFSKKGLVGWFRFFVLILFVAENAHSQIYVLPNLENNFKAAFFKIRNLSCETKFQKFSGFSCFFDNKN